MQVTTTQVESKKSMIFPSLAFLSVEPGYLNKVVEQLRSYREIQFLSPLTGRFDLLLQVNSSDMNEVYSLISKIRSIPGVRATHTYFPIDGFLNATPKRDEVCAFMLINTRAEPKTLINNLKTITGVWGAYSVPGEFDIIVSLHARDYNELLSTVQKVAEVQGVYASETLIAFRPVWA
jgi:DNA-binding Lrp family transcriptional regulator